MADEHEVRMRIPESRWWSIPEILWVDHILPFVPHKDLAQLSLSCRFMHHIWWTTIPKTIQADFLKSANANGAQNIVKISKVKDWPQIEHLIPETVTRLKFRAVYKETMEMDGIAERITDIELGGYFNQPVGRLPPSLQRLCLKSQTTLEHDLDRLPASLTHLTFEGYCIVGMDNLPPSLLELRLILEGPGRVTLDNLPPHLSALQLTLRSTRFFFYVLDKLPQSLNQLILERHAAVQSINHFPDSIRTMALCKVVDPITKWPLNLVDLTLDGGMKTRGIDQNVLDTLPDTLTRLRLVGQYIGRVIKSLPPSLQKLCCGNKVDIPIRCEFPVTLTHLELGLSTSIPQLPPNLTLLSISHMGALPSPLPDSLKVLRVPKGYPHPLPDCDGLEIRRI